MLMVEMTFDEVIKAAEQLTHDEQAALVEYFRAKITSDIDMSPTRDELIAELAALHASGVFDHVESLRNQYANPTFDNLTDEQLLADIHEAATEWEQELDEFFRTED